MRVPAPVFLLVVGTGCGGSTMSDAGPIEAGVDAGPPVLCDFVCGIVDAGIDGSTMRCRPGEVCGVDQDLPGFQCCTRGPTCAPSGSPSALPHCLQP